MVAALFLLLFTTAATAVPKDFDCQMRLFALQRVKTIQPHISAAQLKAVADALNGSPEAQCRNITVTDLTTSLPQPPLSAARTGAATVVVSPFGDDANGDGTVLSPFRTLSAAVAHARLLPHPHRTIALRGGVHRLASPLRLGPRDSGLAFTNFDSESPVVSGAVPLRDLVWTRVANNVSAKNVFAAPVPRNLSFAGLRVGGQAAIKARYPNADPWRTLNPSGWITAGTRWLPPTTPPAPVRRGTAVLGVRPDPHDPTQTGWTVVSDTTPLTPGGPSIRQGGLCLATTGWDEPLFLTACGNVSTHQDFKYDAHSKQFSIMAPAPTKLYEACLQGSNPLGKVDVYRCSPSNLNEQWVVDETAGTICNAAGVCLAGRTPSAAGPIDYAVTDPRWTRHDTKGPATYSGGIDTEGSCAHLEPPYGYWCQSAPPRSPSQRHRSPSGLDFSRGQLPHAPYAKPEGALVHACNLANCWFTWAFEVDSQTNSTLQWSKGGFQGAEGFDSAGHWFIEGVLEELDAPGEYHYEDGLLYYVHNDTTGAPPPPSLRFEAVERQRLVDVHGTQAKPVSDLSFRGITFVDTATTLMEPHGMPSAGDWTLHRGGALTFEGVRGVTVDNCTLRRVDGNGISINGFARNVSVTATEFNFIGETAIALWGNTRQGVGGGDITLPAGVGIDGLGGDQPRGTIIRGNFVHEIGAFQKQASAVFQAVACETVIEDNVFFNGPRALINLNDQFGGGNVIAGNVMFNSCRETADHGPLNSWGRIPYVTAVRDGSTPSVTPAVSELSRNFVIANYNSQEAFDHDDASEYFEEHHNFLVYGQHGLKSYFGGHDNIAHNNLYAFTIGPCVFIGFGHETFLANHTDGFFNNTCIMQSNGGRYGYTKMGCSGGALSIMHDNVVSFPGATANSSVRECGVSLEQWQAKGNDLRTRVVPLPPAEDIIAAARVLLQNK